MRPIEPFSGGELALVTIALSLGVFMLVLDSTIANVALPTISGNLGTAVSQGTWVITSFAVANAITIPLTGWLARRFGEVKVYLLTLGLFIFSSFLCGISTNLSFLIFSRIFQGAVAGPMAPLSQSLLLACYPPAKKNIGLGLWSLVIVIAPIFGPILGGWISNNWHWSWIFFINIPFGLLALFLTWYSFKGLETPVNINFSLDKVGLILMVIGVGSLQIFLDKGKELDWFNSVEIRALFIISLITLIYFVIWEIGEKNPLVNLFLFKDRNFAISVIALSLGFLLYFGVVVLMPLLLQTQYGYTAIWAGLLTAPIGILSVIISPIIGKFSNRLDMRIVLTISFITFAICFFWRSTFQPEMTIWDLFWPQFWQGLAISTFFMPLMAIGFKNIKSQDLAAASSIANFFRTLAGGIGTSFVTTMWEKRTIFHYERLTESISLFDAYTGKLASLSQVNPNSHIQNALLANMIGRQASIMGSNDFFYICGILVLFLIFIIWLVKN